MLTVLCLLRDTGSGWNVTDQSKWWHLPNYSSSSLICCCCSQPTPPCLFRGVLSCIEVMGHPVPVSSLGFKCPYCFIWICSYIVYPSKMSAIQGQLPRCFYIWLAFLMAGCVEGIRRALVLGLVLIEETAIEQAPSVGPLFSSFILSINVFPVSMVAKMVYRLVEE